MQDMRMLILLHSPIMDCCIYFCSLKLTLAGQTAEHVNYSGQATSLLGLASYSTTFANGCGQTQGWHPDINTNAAANNNGLNTRQGYLVRPPNPKGSFQ